MDELTDYDKFEQVVTRLDPGSKLLHMWMLKGGISAQVSALEILCSNGKTKRVVVRQYGDMDVNQNPQVASNEFKLLQLLRSAGLPTPQSYFFDESSEIFPQPYVVIEFMEGQNGIDYIPPDVPTMMSKLAECLSKIHKVRYPKQHESFLRKQIDVLGKLLAGRPVILDKTMEEGRIRDTLELCWTSLQKNQEVVLHGDFWIGNTLWREGGLVAVIDWEDAAFGDPLTDLANGRLEVLWAFGTDAMHEFTRQYQFRMPSIDFTNLPYWDLCAALRPIAKLSDWGLDEMREKQMRDRLRWFVSQAFHTLSLLN